MKEDIDKFDTSDYPPNNIYGIPLANKKRSGLMKDENNGRIMLKFIGLKSKMNTIKFFYSPSEREAIKLKLEKCDDYDSDFDIEKHLLNLGIIKKDKGITSARMREITCNDYYNCLFNNIVLNVTEYLIRSKKLEVYIINQRKVALTPYDDKRMVN